MTLQVSDIVPLGAMLAALACAAFATASIASGAVAQSALGLALTVAFLRAMVASARAAAYRDEREGAL